MVARLTIILYISCKVCSNEFFNITAAATDHFYSLSFKDILGSLPHIPRKHNYNTHLTKHRSYPALASTSFR